jgi:hypothetical protein
MRPYDTLGTFEDSTSRELDLVVHFMITSGIKGVTIWYLGQFSRSWFSQKLELLILIERIGLMITGAHSWESPNIGPNLNIICKIYFLQSKMLFLYCWWRCFKICKFRPTYSYFILINVFCGKNSQLEEFFCNFNKRNNFLNYDYKDFLAILLKKIN